MTDWTNVRQELMMEAEGVTDSNVAKLANESGFDDFDLVEKHAQIRADENEYETKYRTTDFGDKVFDATKKEDLKTFAGARMILAAAEYKANDGGWELVEKEGLSVEGVEKLIRIDDRYGQFLIMETGDIVDHIKRKDDEIYGVVKEYIASQDQDLQTVQGPESTLNDSVRQTFLSDRIDEIRSQIEEAVIELIEQRELTNVIEDIEEAVIEAGKAAEVREDVEQVIKEEIQDLEEQVQWGLREQRTLILEKLQDIQTAQSGGAESIDDIRDLVDDLSKRRSEMDERLERLAAHEADLEDAIQRVQWAADSASRDEIENLVESELEKLQSVHDNLESTTERLEAERDRLAEEIDTVEETRRVPHPDAETGTNEDAAVIKASLARTYELDFVSRFERSVQEAESITTPDGTLSDPALEPAPHNHRSELLSALEASENPSTYPIRSSSRFEIYERGLVGSASNPSLRLESVTTTRLKRYAEEGKDWIPTSLEELHVLIDEARDRAERDSSSSLFSSAADVHHLLVFGSPTGWTEEAIKQVEAEGARFGTETSVYLVNLHTHEVYYDDGDRILEQNAEILSRALPEEQAHECAQAIVTEYLSPATTDLLALKFVSEELDFEPHIVRRAFDRLEADGKGHLEETDRGLVLKLTSAAG
jgi:Mg2+ and Co2+ transporter CorA